MKGGTANAHMLQWKALVLETNPSQTCVADTGGLGCHPRVLAVFLLHFSVSKLLAQEEAQIDVPR